MKPDPLEQRPWSWPYPQSWPQVFAVIVGMDLALLALLYLIEWLTPVPAK